MQDLKIDGVGKVNGGTYGQVFFDGVSECAGDLNCKKLEIDGVFKCSGTVQTEELLVDGVASFRGNVKAGKINVDGVFSAKKALKIEADEIFCDGSIDGMGEISADKINVDGYIGAKEIVGDTVRIKSRAIGLLELFQFKKSRVDLIEATTVELEGVRAKKVSGTDVSIGQKCVVESVDCNGRLHIDAGATVGEITGTYKKI